MLVVLAETGVNDVQFADFRVEENSDGKLDALHVPVGSLGEDLVFTGLHVVDDGSLDEGDFEVITLAVDLWTQTEEFIELDGVVTDIDCITSKVP